MLEFSKSKRLLKGSEFKAVKGTRLTVSSPQLLLLAKQNVFSHPRLGLAVTKRHAKLAVERNRIKRVARESFRHNITELPDLDIILLVRSGITKLDKKELHQCLKHLWKQLAKRANRLLSS